MMREIKLGYKISFSIVLLFIVIGVALLLGSAEIQISEAMRIIGSKLPLIGKNIELDGIPITYQAIILNLRLPRILLSLLAGMGLSIAGCVFQGVFANPMADPYLLGISSGAALGATLAILFPISNGFFSTSFISLCAFAGGILVMLFVFVISTNKGRLPSITLILAGIAINYFATSMISLLMLFNKEKIENIYFWTLGSFKDTNYMEIGFLAVVLIVSFLLIYRKSVELNLIMMNEEQAKSLGVATDSIKKQLLIISSFMVAVIVSVCGIIGFVGLIVPHVARMLIGPDHKIMIPFSMVLGGVFMIISDTIARSLLTNTEISVGIITALFGVPFFLILLVQNKRKLI